MLEFAGLALSAVQTLLAALQCPQLGNIRSIVEYKSQLDDLQGTVETLQSVLRDAAEIKEEPFTHQEKDQIEKIKDAVYEADDLFDKIVTVAQQKQLLKDDGSVSEKIRSFCSLSSNPLLVSKEMSHQVKKIKKKLDAIATNKQFSFKHDSQPIRNRRPDTCSYVNQVHIVGREDDLEKIVGMLLQPSDDQRHNVSFLSVVGLGGLGKTALAQLVFNDPRVTSAFSWRNWTCVADQDQKELDVTQVLGKILEREGSTLEQAQSQLREKLAGERYLLVLDDVWTEKQFQWRELVTFLSGGQKGSWIVVTTRSHKTAEIVGGQVHKLQGLSEEDSWSLFQQSALTSNPPDDLVKIGRKIVDKCAGVPLAIKVVGSFLYGQDRGRWNLVQEMGLANIRQSDNDILPILKLSFHHLETPLKSCFAYCALFPKDFEMDTVMLKSLWMAQGYVVPLDEGQSIEDACEEYFSILLRRCFFQDIKKNYYGEITSCKIHDLMHDIALDVSGKEILCATYTIGGNLDKKVRHLLVERLKIMRERGNYSLFGKSCIRSYLHTDTYINLYIKEDTQFPVYAIVTNYRFLRALDLSSLGIKSLPDSIGELLHLRYLDLSRNRGLQMLPKSFTKLYNLQTLKLKDCESLRKLPKDLSRLVNIRLLDVRDCKSLRYMPKGIGKLSCLHYWLSDFKVGGGGSSPSWKQWFDSLEDLKALNKLKGRLDISIRWPKRDKNIVKEDGGLYMRNKEHLNAIRFDFKHEEGDDGGKDEELSLMEDMQPHSNLERLNVVGYNGVKMPGWLTLVQNMVSLCLNNCGELEYLPCLGNLCHLKSIELTHLPKLEYIGVDDSSWANSNTTMPSSDKELSFFPSLEEVTLWNLPKLKGWTRGVVGRVDDSNSGNNLQSQQLLPCLSQLRILRIYKCPELTCIPSCPGLQFLDLIIFNQGLQIMNKKRDEVAPASSSASTSGYEIVNPTLQTLTIDNMAWPNSLPSGYLHRVSSLNVCKVEEEVDMPNWMQFLPALQTLYIYDCKEIPKWMPKLTSLKLLSLWNCSESVKRRCQKDPPGEDWPYIQHIPDIQFYEFQKLGAFCMPTRPDN